MRKRTLDTSETQSMEFQMATVTKTAMGICKKQKITNIAVNSHLQQKLVWGDNIEDIIKSLGRVPLGNLMAACRSTKSQLMELQMVKWMKRVCEDPQQISQVPPNLPNITEVVRCIVDRPYEWRYTLAKCRSPMAYAIMKIAVQQDGKALKYASPELKADPSIVLPAVQQDGMALQFAHKKLKHKRFVILQAVQQSGMALKFAYKKHRASAGIVLPAVQQNGWALQYASPELKADPSIVLPAVQQHGRALQYASPELKADPIIVLPAVNKGVCAPRFGFAGPILPQD